MYLTNVLSTKPQTMLTMWADHRELGLFLLIAADREKKICLQTSRTVNMEKHRKKKKAHQIIVLEYVMLEVM